MSNSTFEDLVILDMANNHQGDLSHGLKIIREHSKIIKKNNVKAALKFQFRDLPNFVHASARSSKSNKHINRFLSTQISWEDFLVMQQECVKCGLLTICTPFDEPSVDRIVKMKFDYIKVASCLPMIGHY